MDYEQLQQYRRSLLDQALTEGLRRNDEQTQTWSEYKKRHEQVIESLQIFPKELSVECMVPLGKKAMMRGKLTHTNEILVSLGDGYFAEYSAAQATDLCHRRIKNANGILENLEKEKNLYEMRQRIPDAFGGEDTKDLIEHWEEEKLDDWRVEHRKREKEYRKKLSELQNTEKPEIQTVDDLFAKLDALELQEELEAELHRLEAKRPDFYADDLAEGEVYEETDESSEEASEESDESDDSSEKNETESHRPKTIEENEKPSIVNFSSSIDIPNTKIESTIDDSKNEKLGAKSRDVESRDKKVVFGESQIKYFNEDDDIVKISENPSVSRPSTSTNEIIDTIAISEENSTETEDDEVVRIEFKHSDFEPAYVEEKDEKSFSSPRDIYKLISGPKSILKISNVPSLRETENLSTVDDSEDIDDGSVGTLSTYGNVVRDIREHVVDKSTKEVAEPAEEKRPMSKFRRERAAMKK